MPDKHLSSQFDSEMNAVSSRVMELGGLVESQLRHVMYALSQFSPESAAKVIEIEATVNAMEVEIDRDISSIIGRRQPTARDLRLLMAMSKTTANLERVGDEARKIARMVLSIIEKSGTVRALPASELRVAAELATGLLRKALDVSKCIKEKAASFAKNTNTKADQAVGSSICRIAKTSGESSRKEMAKRWDTIPSDVRWKCINDLEQARKSGRIPMVDYGMLDSCINDLTKK